MTEKSRKPRSFSVTTEAPAGEPHGIANRRKTSASSRSARADEAPRKPRVIAPGPSMQFEPDEAANRNETGIDALTPPPVQPMKHGFGWGKLAFSAFAALAGIAIGLAVDSFIRDLFARNDWLGWAALAIAAVGALAVLVLVVRELAALARLRTLSGMREAADEVRQTDDLAAARNITLRIVALYGSRPETAHGRALLAENASDIMDGSDLIHLIERDLLAPLDKTARTLVMNAAKRVSVVTAVSPRAVVDILYVLFENTRLVRRIAEHYGARPGFFASFGLMRRVLTHLAATGAIAVGDSLIQQMIGHGLAARLSARLGEGVVNGLLTARIGIAAIDVCRPLAFDAEKRPGVNEFLAELVRFGNPPADASSASGQAAKAAGGDKQAAK